MADYANANVPASTNVFTEDLLNKMMGNIDAAGQARLAQQRAARDTVIQGYQRDAEKAKPQYQLARDQANYQAKVGADATDERNARLGLFDSGRNISDQLKLEAIRQANLKGITSEERNYLNDIDWKIKRLQEEGIAADDAILADLQSQKDQLMLSIYDRIQAQNNADRSYNYQVGRDAILDSRYADETAYNRGRDAISDERYNIEWEYKKRQDILSRSGSGSGSGSSSGDLGIDPDIYYDTDYQKAMQTSTSIVNNNSMTNKQRITLLMEEYNKIKYKDNPVDNAIKEIYIAAINSLQEQDITNNQFINNMEYELWLENPKYRPPMR